MSWGETRKPSERAQLRRRIDDLEAELRLLKPSIEIRTGTLTNHPGEGELFDELVARNVSIHMETMSDDCVWLCVRGGDREVTINVTTRDDVLHYTVEEGI